MAWYRGSTTTRGQHEPVVEQRCQSLDPERADPRCRELERERDAIEPATDVANCRRIRIAQRETAGACRRALDEQSGGREPDHVRRAQAFTRLGTMQGKQSKDMLALDAQGL